MTQGVRWGARLLLGVGLLLALRAATAVSLPGPSRHGEAWLRLSWSARPERVETCRRLTDAELEARPAHMRLRLECTGRFARYELGVFTDDVPLTLDTVRGGGVRNDRPMHVLRELAIEPGQRRVRVELVRLDSTEAAADNGASSADSAQATGVLGERERREADERARSARAAIAPRLVLDTTVSLERGRVLLVTYDADLRQLVAVPDTAR